MTDDNTGESRREVLKKGALASSALVLGASASAGTAAAQDGRALVFSYDFHPGQSFDVIAQLQQSTTVRVLRTAEEDTVPEISQPDQWTGYVIRYDMETGDETAGTTTFLFTRGNSLSTDDTESFVEDASMYSPRLNLLISSLD